MTDLRRLFDDLVGLEIAVWDAVDDRLRDGLNALVRPDPIAILAASEVADVPPANDHRLHDQIMHDNKVQHTHACRNYLDDLLRAYADELAHEEARPSSPSPKLRQGNRIWQLKRTLLSPPPRRGRVGWGRWVSLARACGGENNPHPDPPPAWGRETSVARCDQSKSGLPRRSLVSSSDSSRISVVPRLRRLWRIVGEIAEGAPRDGEPGFFQMSSYVTKDRIKKDFPQVESRVYLLPGIATVIRGGQALAVRDAAMVDGPFFALSNNLGLELAAVEHYRLVRGERGPGSGPARKETMDYDKTTITATYDAARSHRPEAQARWLELVAAHAPSDPQLSVGGATAGWLKALDGRAPKIATKPVGEPPADVGQVACQPFGQRGGDVANADTGEEQQAQVSRSRHVQEVVPHDEERAQHQHRQHRRRLGRLAGVCRFRPERPDHAAGRRGPARADGSSSARRSPAC